MATETELRKPFVKALRAAGAKVVSYVGSTYGDKGTADVFVAHKLWHGWIEFKGPKTAIEPLQRIFNSDMRKRGVNAVFVRMLDEKNFRINETDLIYTWSTGFDILEALNDTE